MQKGKYIMNRRAVEVNSTLYPLPYDASPLVMSWNDGIEVQGEINNGMFYPHVKL